VTGPLRRSEGLSALARSLFNFLARKPGVVLVAALAIVFSGAAWGAIGVLNRYFEALDANRKWIDDVRIDSQDRMLRVIFERAVEQGLIWAEMTSNGVRVGVVSCENRRDGLGPEGVGPRGDIAQKNKQSLSLLCTTEHGAQVREEIRQWNDSEYLISIRDDRNKVIGATANRRPITCQEAPRSLGRQPAPKAEVRTAFATIPRRCLVNRWTISLLTGDRDLPGNSTPLETLALEPAATEFDFIASDGPRFMSDWASVTPIANVGPNREDLRYLLRSEIVLPADGMVRIDLVGRPGRVVAGQANLNIDATPPTAARPASARGRDGIEVAVRMRCDRQYAPRGDCTRILSGGAPVPLAYIIEVRGRARQTVTVDIETQLERNLPRTLLQALPDPSPEKPAAAGSQDEDDDDESDTEGPTKAEVGARTPNLIVGCPQEPEDGATTPCEISWRPVPDPDEPEPETIGPSENESERAKPAKAPNVAAKTPNVATAYRVVMAGDPNRNLVVPATGDFTVDAFDLGLGPVVGAGPTQFGSLTRALRGSADQSATLTIDPVAQRVVRDVLEDRRRRCGGSVDCIFAQRGVRASVVLMDASDDHAGEIRAMIAWPPGEVGSHVWDLAAGGGGAWRSTATSRQAWSVGFDGFSQPGSTFKSVTALAAIDTALDPGNPARNDLGRLLRGEMNQAEQVRFLGLRTRVGVPQAQRGRDCRAQSGADSSAVNMLFVPKRGGGSFACLQNFGDAAHSTYFMPTSVSRCPTSGDSRGATQLGMCEALIKSSNTFFGGVSLLLDGPKVFAAGAGEHPPAANALALARAAERLMPPQGDANAFNDLMRGALPRRASLLFYDPRPVTIENSRPDPASATAPKPDRRVMAATAGYGQNVYAAPMVMASIYASIGANRIVRPRLVPLEKLPADRPRDPLEGAPLLANGAPQEQARYLAILRAGLHGVVAARGGSATSYFANAQSLVLNGGESRLFGKSGTATITKRYNTTWLVGWIEGNPNSGITKRLAFTCEVIRQPAGQKMTGGRVCGPLIRDILLRLDQKRS
jgi:cell division protein FtsI/penicillin-binding protein 2